MSEEMSDEAERPLTVSGSVSSFVTFSKLEGVIFLECGWVGSSVWVDLVEKWSEGATRWLVLIWCCALSHCYFCTAAESVHQKKKKQTIPILGWFNFVIHSGVFTTKCTYNSYY